MSGRLCRQSLAAIGAILVLGLTGAAHSGPLADSASTRSPKRIEGFTVQGHPGGLRGFLGPRFRPQPDVQLPPPRQKPVLGADTAARVRYWNQAALEANAIDHLAPQVAGEEPPFGEQLGPTRTSRAFAIIHIAMFDALNAIGGYYQSYTDLPRAPGGTSPDAALAQAAHDTLVALYPAQTGRFDTLLQNDLNRLPDGPPKARGVDLGHRAAAAILALRANDGSQYEEPEIGIDYFPSPEPGQWRPDPVSNSPLALGAYWGQVRPFVMRSGAQFRLPPPPALASAEYAAAFDEVKRLGGDGVITPTQRTGEQTVAGIYWGYDGTPGLGTPPRLFNQIAVHIATLKGTPPLELARLLALLNVALADGAIAAWDSKYVYDFWRPVAAIREADPGTGPTAKGDSNPATQADPWFTPLGAPASNLDGPDFTPPFPAYPSGHATFASILFQILRSFYGTDDIAFTFVSDEYNGVTRDNDGTVRPLLPRSFPSLSAAEEESGQSRIYLGIHWAFDKQQGFVQGRNVADYVFTHAFMPVHRPGRHDGQEDDLDRGGRRR